MLPQEQEQLLLQRYLSNLDGDIYAIANLPEEVIAVIFAYVSRSPNSFRDNLLKLLSSGDLGAAVPPADATPALDYASEKARHFHEKWVVQYGHSSVAEHAIVHLGVERISRFASSLLELSNPFLSFTEYSQRYQRPQRGAYHTPAELEPHPELQHEFRSFQDRSFHAYERVQAALFEHLLELEPRAAEESEKRYHSRVEKLSFEDARYLLSLAVHTNLGMTANGRALRDAIVQLLAHPYREIRHMAETLRQEAKKMLPALLRYAEANPYQAEFQQKLASDSARLSHGRADAYPTFRSGAAAVQLLDHDPDGLDHLLAHCLYGATSRSRAHVVNELRQKSDAEKSNLFRTWVSGIGSHDPLPEGFRHLRYRFEILLSEANWHQLLRHCRGIDFLAQLPTTELGITVPPRAQSCGLDGIFSELAEASARLHSRLLDLVPEAAPYVVLNMHHRRVIADLHLAELCHLVRLRGKADAQWDIRYTVEQMWQSVLRVHPFLQSLPFTIARDGFPAESASEC